MCSRRKIRSVQCTGNSRRSGFSIAAVAPTFLLAVVGSLIAGPALGWLVLRLTERVKHVPTAIILQFVSTFGVWMLAERVGFRAC